MSETQWKIVFSVTIYRDGEVYGGDSDTIEGTNIRDVLIRAMDNFNVEMSYWNREIHSPSENEMMEIHFQETRGNKQPSDWHHGYGCPCPEC